MKVGIGYDIHQLVRNRKLFLGGVKISHKRGLFGHSDADVVLHAISDALLGACGLDDIGVHFPDTDKKYKNISSKKILGKVYELIRRKKARVINVDCTIIAEEPNISKYRTAMKKCISEILNTKNVNIKATTNEGIGFIGKNKGIACFAVVLVK